MQWLHLQSLLFSWALLSWTVVIVCVTPHLKDKDSLRAFSLTALRCKAFSMRKGVGE